MAYYWVGCNARLLQNEFFKQNAEKLKMDGVKELSGEQFESVKKKVEDEQNASFAAFGNIFEGN